MRKTFSSAISAYNAYYNDFNNIFYYIILSILYGYIHLLSWKFYNSYKKSTIRNKYYDSESPNAYLVTPFILMVMCMSFSYSYQLFISSSFVNNLTIQGELLKKNPPEYMKNINMSSHRFLMVHR